MNSDWELLNLEPPCTVEELKKSFRKLAFAYHPDLGGDAAKFIQVKAAYDRLLVVLDPSPIQSSEKVVEEFIKELIEQYNQAFPWRPTTLARRELANINQLRLGTGKKMLT